MSRLFFRGSAVLAPLFLDAVRVLDEARAVDVAHERRHEAPGTQAQHHGGGAPVHPDRHPGQRAAHPTTDKHTYTHIQG